MIVEEEDELAQRRELVRERLRELRETPLETGAAIQEGSELLAESRGVTPQSADQIGEKDERVLVAALQGEPGRAPAGCAEKVGVLRQHGRLAVAGGRVHQRQPVATGPLEPIEQPLPSQEWERQ
jgi:hypothetical protein